jgi:predicted RNase H-like HicB family nuclease/post-segregation antitoxin (ccd killing protein)
MTERPARYAYPSFIGFDIPTGRYYVLFHDLPGCTTTGDTEEEVLTNAKEALSLHLFGMEDDGDDIPLPSSIVGLRGENGEAVVLVEVWMPSFREKMETKAVNRTVTLPGWLDKEAKAAELNYSQILQDGIMQRLNISRTVARRKTKTIKA